MLVLLTGGTSAIAGEIASRLTRDGHIVRLTDRVAGADSVLCTLEADDATAALMDGVDHIVHVEPCLALPLQEDAWLDICTRCSYNLLTAASEASIDRVTLLNTMDIFMPYDLSLGVLPDWQPLPSTLPAVLGPHLAEYTALEFALVGAVRVLTARLGALHATEAEALAAGARWWISPAEAADVLATALAADIEAAPGARGHNLLSRQPWVRINLAHGGISQQGYERGAWWTAANGGLRSWSRPPAPAPVAQQRRRSVGEKPLALLLGGSGMFGPDIIKCLENTGEYSLRITDVVDRPQIRDEAQVRLHMRAFSVVVNL
jgi:hypothetical protein